MVRHSAWDQILVESAGVLGSYLATQAAARAGIGRYGPLNPKPGTATGRVASQILKLAVFGFHH